MTNTLPIRIILLDSHPALIEALLTFFNTGSEWEVVGAAKNIKDAKLILKSNESPLGNEIYRTEVDVVIMDIHLPDGEGHITHDGGIIFIAELRNRYPDLPILVYSGKTDVELARRLLSAGASGYLMKGSASSLMKQAVNVVVAGGTFLDPALSRRPLVAPRESLTPKEEKVMRLLSGWKTDKQISKELKLSSSTIRKYRYNIQLKFGLYNITERRREAVRRHGNPRSTLKHDIDLNAPISRGGRLTGIGNTERVNIGNQKPIGNKSIGGQERDLDYAVVRVFYATDRNRKSSSKPTEIFGKEREALSFGYCDVSIPRDHRIGELESRSIWRLEFRENPKKHVVLLSTIVRSQDEFFEDLESRIRPSATLSAFVFVHGYNVTFEDAARRTAQISYDLAFDGASIFYSWPSQGRAGAYTVDEQNIEWAQANLRTFLEDFFARSVAQNVYLIAHSMGNRALTRAVASLLDDHPSLRSRLKEMILTAPDIDADVFKRDIAPALAASCGPVTLYASSADLALLASKKVHGYARAGDSGKQLIVVPGVETIDATYVDTSLMGHSYFAENRSVLSDMFYLISNGQRASKRFGLRRVNARMGCYWEFKR
jgi:esterase/lipase superfamily enzyme/DNA-binding NarL/FixJ family response regulator